MLKLNASYSKKVPAEGEYTSQSYHASIEVELPDGLSPQQLNDKIHDTFELVKNSVEAELHGTSSGQTTTNNNTAAPSHNQQNTNSVPASPKQIRFLLDLAKGRGITPAQIAAQHGVTTVEQLSKRQCSELINSWRVA